MYLMHINNNVWYIHYCFQDIQLSQYEAMIISFKSNDLHHESVSK